MYYDDNFFVDHLMININECCMCAVLSKIFGGVSPISSKTWLSDSSAFVNEGNKQQKSQSIYKYLIFSYFFKSSQI